MRALSRKQEKAIAALLSHRTMEEVAQAVGVGQSTMFRWLQEPEFQKAYQEAKHRVVDQVITKLQQASSEAVDNLREIMLDQDKPASTRVSAAKTILAMAIKAVELEEITERVGRLEEAADSMRVAWAR